MAAWILRQVSIISFIVVLTLGMPQIPANDSYLVPRGVPLFEIIDQALEHAPGSGFKELDGTKYAKLINPAPDNIEAFTDCLVGNPWKKERLVLPYRMGADETNAGIFWVFADGYIFRGLIPSYTMDYAFEEREDQAAVWTPDKWKTFIKGRFLSGSADEMDRKWPGRTSLRSCQQSANSESAYIYGVVIYFPKVYQPPCGLMTGLLPLVDELRKSIAHELRISPKDPRFKTFLYHESAIAQAKNGFAVFDITPGDPARATLYTGPRKSHNPPTWEVEFKGPPCP